MPTVWYDGKFPVHGATQEDVQEQLLRMKAADDAANAEGGGTRAIAGLLSSFQGPQNQGLDQSVARAPLSMNTIPTINGGAAAYMRPQQLSETLGIIQRDSTNKLQAQLQERARVTHEIDAEKNRQQSLKLYGERVKSEAQRAKIAAKSREVQEQIKADRQKYTDDKKAETEKVKATKPVWHSWYDANGQLQSGWVSPGTADTLPVGGAKAKTEPKPVTPTVQTAADGTVYQLFPDGTTQQVMIPGQEQINVDLPFVADRAKEGFRKGGPVGAAVGALSGVAEGTDYEYPAVPLVKHVPGEGATAAKKGIYDQVADRLGSSPWLAPEDAIDGTLKSLVEEGYSQEEAVALKSSLMSRQKTAFEAVDEKALDKGMSRAAALVKGRPRSAEQNEMYELFRPWVERGLIAPEVANMHLGGFAKSDNAEWKYGYGDQQRFPETVTAAPAAPTPAPQNVAPVVSSASPGSFDQWYANIARTNKLDPNPDDPRHHYDYRAYYEAIRKGEAQEPVPWGNSVSPQERAEDLEQMRTGKRAPFPPGTLMMPDKFKTAGHETPPAQSAPIASAPKPPLPPPIEPGKKYKFGDLISRNGKTFQLVSEPGTWVEVNK